MAVILIKLYILGYNIL